MNTVHWERGQQINWNENQTTSEKEDIIDNDKEGMHNDRYGHLHFAGGYPGQENVEERWKWPHPTLESKFKLINLGDHSLLLTWRSLPTGAEGCKQPWQFMRSQSISQCHRVQSLKSRLKGGFVQVDINSTEGWHWHWTISAHDKERKMSDSKWGQLFMSM